MFPTVKIDQMSFTRKHPLYQAPPSLPSKAILKKWKASLFSLPINETAKHFQWKQAKRQTPPAIKTALFFSRSLVLWATCPIEGMSPGL